MSNDLTKAGKAQFTETQLAEIKALPEKTKAQLRSLLISPEKYYNDLPYTSIRSVVLEGSGITLQFLSRNIPRLQFSAIMTVAIGEAFEQLNAKNTLTTKQIEYIVSDLVARFGYITLDEVKYCIRYNIAHADIYDRLDSNVILKWFMEYDHKRDEKLVEANRNAEYEKENVSIENTITFEQHMEDLKQKADAGDEKSKELYDTYMRNRKQFEHIENFHKKHNLKK